MADAFLKLRNVGKACRGDLQLLGIESIAQLAQQNADDLYLRLAALTGKRQDPCVHDVFAAIIHEAQTGEPRNWWAFTPARKVQQAEGTFPAFK
jgi:nucleotidyltransferase/DNA polymerase involved in DNA repair